MFGKFNKKSNNKLKNRKMVSALPITILIFVFAVEEPFKMERWKNVQAKI
jgi:hypothetical protein